MKYKYHFIPFPSISSPELAAGGGMKRGDIACRVPKMLFRLRLHFIKYTDIFPEILTFVPQPRIEQRMFPSFLKEHVRSVVDT